MNLMKSRAVAICASIAFGALVSMALAQGYNTANYMAQGGSLWEVGGTLDVAAGGEITYGGTKGFNVTRGNTSLAGTNPTTVTTGLTTISSCAVVLNESAIGSAGLGTTTLTYTASGGTLSVYAWKPTSVSNPTLIASTGTDAFSWNCLGS
ncbi:MAG TPA: hypothetical protein VNX86_04720 [Rhizomicrobium sp.]|jgi:hypothetical protein|nr:hypothetical protein [Rhizomicrobium sp.]